MAKFTKKYKKIAVVSGIRSDYPIVYPVMKEIEKHNDLKLQVIVTGAHLLKKFGYTIKGINKDFKISAAINIDLKDDRLLTVAKSFGKGVMKFAQCFADLKPDIVVVTADRIEMLAPAQAAAIMNLPLAHIHAGDVSLGNIDESIRYVISRFSHILFAATENSAKRLIQTGEEKWRVFVTGAPQIDTIKSLHLIAKKDLLAKFKLPSPYAIALQNPVIASPRETVESTESILKVLSEAKIPTVVIHPNSDSGSEDIIKIISRYKKNSNFRIFKNLSSVEYLSLLKSSLFLIGNSTSGIIEAPFFDIPFLNIGIRQFGRDAADNLILIERWDKNVIKKAIAKLMNRKDKFICKNNPYGKGGASQKIVKVLRETEINERWLEKGFHSLLR